MENIFYDKYLDLLSNSKVREVKIIYFEDNRESFHHLKNAYETHKDFLHGELKGYFLPWESFRLNYIQNVNDIKYILELVPRSIVETLKQELLRSDLTIVEINSESSLLLVPLLYSLGISYILAISDRIMLFKSDIQKLSNMLGKENIIVFPDKGMASVICSEFQLNEKKIITANVNWPSKFTYEKYLKDIRTEKLSKKLKKPQLCIVSPNVCYKVDENPLSVMSYYVDLIENFLNLGFMVHLYTRKIIKSFSEPITEKMNDYSLLYSKFGGRFNIYDLSKELHYPKLYYEISKYDYGLIIPVTVDFGENIYLVLQEMYYYNYMMAKLNVIAYSKFVNEIIPINSTQKLDLLFFDKVNDLKKYELAKKEEGKYEMKNFYSDFIDSIFQELHY